MMRFVPCLCARVKIGGRLVIEGLMRTPVIVEMEVTLQCRPEVAATGEVAGIDQFVLQRAPEPFDENVVEASPASIHADADFPFAQRPREVRGSELRALIGVEDLRLAPAKGGV